MGLVMKSVKSDFSVYLERLLAPFCNSQEEKIPEFSLFPHRSVYSQLEGGSRVVLGSLPYLYQCSDKTSEILESCLDVCVSNVDPQVLVEFSFLSGSS